MPLPNGKEECASDLKSTVALIVGLEITTLSLIYSAAAEKPAAFGPFYNTTLPLQLSLFHLPMEQ